MTCMRACMPECSCWERKGVRADPSCRRRRSSSCAVVAVRCRASCVIVVVVNQWSLFWQVPLRLELGPKDMIQRQVAAHVT